MTGASIETTLELWASSLREVKKRMRPLFEQDRTALNAGLFVDGLLGDERRKTGWSRAEAAGDPGPWRQLMAGCAFGVPQNDNGRTCARPSHSQCCYPRREPRSNRPMMHRRVAASTSSPICSR